VLTLPKPNGTLERFEVFGADAVAPDLWAADAGIRTFRGVGLDDPSATLVASLTYQGFHAQVQTPGGWWYIDPLFDRPTDQYQSYFRADYTENPHGGGCRCALCEAAVAAMDGDPTAPVAADPTTPLPRGGTGGGPGFGLTQQGELSFGTSLRTYRAAITTDNPYFNYHANRGTGTPDQNVLSAIATALNRVSGVYETELAVRFQLLASTTKVIYGGVNGASPFTSDDPGVVIGQVQSKLDAVIGPNNYELGHLFSGNGKLAGLAGQGIAQNGREGSGLTGLPVPIGDPFAIDYVAHEVGHQASAGHTFGSLVGGSPPGNRVEPGSGSTIMAYAGLGGGLGDTTTLDYQLRSDAMFSWVNLREMAAYLQGTYDGGFTVAATNNAPPRVTAGADVVIPARSFFALQAAAADPDGGQVLYSWEQADGAADYIPLASPDTGTGALFRPYLPTANPERWFPAQSAVLASTINLNGSVNLDGTAASGLSFGYVRGERLPLTTRELNFVAVARDNKAGGGAFSYDRVNVRVVDTGAAFAVTLGTGLSWAAGSTQTVTWNVAGTAGNGINTDRVRILLSTDGGLTFPFVLADRTANDGTEAVTLPFASSAANGARLKVEPTNSVYFALSNKLTVTAAGTAPAGTVTGVSFVDRNGNGVRDGEPAAPGRLVYADADADLRFDNGLPTVTIAGAYPAALPDRTITRLPYAISGAGGAVADLRVRLSVTHPNPGDLDAFLISPTGRRVELFTSLGFSGADLTNPTLSMAAASGINQAAAPYTGTFRPEGNLLEFAGEPVDGTWTLELTDRVAGNSGTLTGWGLSVVTEATYTGAPVTLSNAADQRVYVPLAVPAVAGTVTDLDVRVNLDNTEGQSLRLWLLNPAITDTATNPVPAGAVRLFEQQPTFATNLRDVVFDDQAATGIAAGGNVQLSGSFRPVDPMTPFYDQPTDPIAGTWRLLVNNIFGDVTPPRFTMTLQDWGVRVSRDFTATGFATLAVPDAGTLVTTLPAPLSGGPIQDVDVRLDVTHPDVSQLKVSLVSPAGTVVRLAANGTGPNFTNTRFDDEASAKFAAGTGPYTAAYRPVETLARLDGEDASGVWTLRIEDTTAGGTGTLNNWAVTLTAPTRVASVAPAAVGVTATRTDTIFVGPADGPLTDLDVSLTLTHPANGEVTAFLISPAGTKVTLVAAAGGANFTTTTFDDEAGTAITAGAAPYTGRFRPAQPLSAFDGEWPGGYWTLRIDDSNLSANAGTLAGWSLSYSTGERFAVTDAAGAYSLAVPAGGYTVREEMPGDLARTAPALGGYAVTVTTGTPAFTGRNFGSTAAVTAGPTLTVNGGQAQRSRVTTLTLTGFGTITAAAAGAFTLTRTGPGTPNTAEPLTATFAAGPNDTTVVTLAFPAAYVDAFGSLIDGRYGLVVNWALVTATGAPLGGTSTFGLHRLFGDVNGDAFVDGTDETAFGSTFGLATGAAGFTAALDVNADGFVDGTDETAFGSRFGTSV
jgi:subtilisin-like proprotein convertase family protein